MTSFADSEQALHDAAIEAAAFDGFDDFGDDAYLEGLRALLQALDREAHLTPVGQFAIRGLITDALKSRLYTEYGWARYPECASARVDRPLVIIGLARTGTSALHHLLANDPALQGLQLWLAHTPKPRPDVKDWPDDEDFRACDARMRAVYERSPEMLAIHRMAADQVDECWYLLAQTFAHSSWDANTNVPSFSKWWSQHDMRPDYQRHKRNLQLIGHREPQKRWLLKDSTHLFDLDAFLSVYPDAMIVHTHRDPVEVIPSTCSLCWSARGPLNEDADRGAFGNSTLELWGRAIDSTLSVRENAPAAQFYDLQFSDFQRDPIAAIHDIYRHFELPLSDEADAAFHSFRADNPQGKHGEHHYSVDEWGLSEGAIRERFARYVERFDL